MVANLTLSLFLSFAVFNGSEIKADNAPATTTVTVSNGAPSFTTAPHEDPTSDGTTPTNVGSNVVIKATATEGTGDNWYLAICKGNNITPVNGDAPTCPDGAWDISDAASSTAEATATYTVTTGETNQTYAWYAFACDDNAGTAMCSSMDNSGTSGGNGSPFSVNHRPTFTAVGNDGPGNPGAADLTVTATTYDDDDDDGAQDTVSLFVCKSSGFTGSACTGDQWCTTAGVTPTVTLACDLTIPDPQAHGTMDYWAYIVDSHGFVATGGKQGSAETFTVSNVAPSVSGTPTLNGTADIDLTSEKSTTNIVITGIGTNDNGCGDMDAAATFANAWLTSLGGASCTDNTNPNKCYFHATCTQTGANACEGGIDKDATYTCTVAFQYYSNPTDANTPWTATSWTATFIPGDGAGASASTANSGIQEMNSYLAMALTTDYDAIAYGSVSAGGKVDPLVEKLRVEAAGNVSIDLTTAGTDMSKSGASIGKEYQRYEINAAEGGHDWADGEILSDTPAATNINVCKSGYSPTLAWKPMYWGIEIPAGQAAGSYTGTNTLTAVKNTYGGADEWCETL